MKVKFICGGCHTETLVEGVTDMSKLSCPVCGKAKEDLKEHSEKSKKILLKG